MLHLRIPRALFNYMESDLSREHDFAYERVGFLFVNTGHTQNNTLLLASDYVPVADDNYIRDSEVGAKINSSAISEVMQKILDTGHGALHVHIHHLSGIPQFSKIDNKNLSLLIPSFKSVGRGTINGALLLQNDSFNSLIWLPGQESPTKLNELTIIGYPLEFRGRY